MKIITNQTTDFSTLCSSNEPHVVLSLSELKLLLDNYPKVVKFVSDFLSFFSSDVIVDTLKDLPRASRDFLTDLLNSKKS